MEWRYLGTRGYHCSSDEGAETDTPFSLKIWEAEEEEEEAVCFRVCGNGACRCCLTIYVEENKCCRTREEQKAE
jgi:hypothetical protein